MKVSLHYHVMIFSPLITFWRPRHGLGWITGWSMLNSFWKQELYFTFSASVQAQVIPLSHILALPVFPIVQKVSTMFSSNKQMSNQWRSSNLFFIQSHDHVVVTQWLTCTVMDYVYSVKSRSYSHLTSFLEYKSEKIISKVLGIDREH